MTGNSVVHARPLFPGEEGDVAKVGAADGRWSLVDRRWSTAVCRESRIIGLISLVLHGSKSS